MATDWTQNVNTALAVKFEDAAASGIAVDSSLNGNDGTVDNSTGVTQGVTGIYGNAIQATAGNNAKLTFPADASNSNKDKITLCVWAYNASYGIAGTISDKAAIVARGFRSGVLAFQTTNQLRWAEHNNNGTALFQTTNGSCVLNTPQHYAVIYDRTTGAPLNAGPSILVDGVAQTVVNNGADLTGGGARDDDSAMPITLFQDTLDTGELDSILDELLIHNDTLTSTDVNNIMDNGIDGSQGITQLYSRTFRFNLPSNDTDLDTAFTTQDYTDVASDDAVRVTQTGQDAYVMFLFKDTNPSSTNNRLSVSWNGQSDVAPSSQAVTLEVYNRNSTTWETVASNSSAAANTDFTLQGTIYPLTNYKDGSGVVACRVRQNVTISSSSCSSSCRSSSSSSRSSSSSSSSCRSSSSSCSSCRSSSSSSSSCKSSSSSCSSCRSSSSSSRNACWVAAELFGGWYAPETIEARAYIVNESPKWFFNFYSNKGQSIAKWIKRNPWSKRFIKPLFIAFANRGKEWIRLNGNVN